MTSVCGDGQDPEQLYTHFDGFYSVTFVDADYPAGNYIGRVSTGWRNDKKQTLSLYWIIYDVGENELYHITYAPRTSSFYEGYSKTGIFSYGGIDYNISEDEAYTDLGKQDVCGKNIPSMKTADGNYVRHFTADETLSGLYFKIAPDWTDEEAVKKSIFAVSGPSDQLDKWYNPNTGRQIRSIRYPCTYFTSPRVTK